MHAPFPIPARRWLVAALAATALLATTAAWSQKVRLTTSMGDVLVELDAERAPKSVENFLQYVRAKHYDGTVFHRIIETFMIQGGGFSADMSQKPTRAPIPLESRNGLKNLRGTLAMARTSDPNSATAQFFINVVDNPFLDADNARDGHGYAVFGRVIEGMEVVDRIKSVPVGNRGPFQNVPQTPVTLTRATVEK